MDYGTSDLPELQKRLTSTRRTVWLRALVGAQAGRGAPPVLALRAVAGPCPPGWQEQTWRYDQCTFVAARVTASRLASWCTAGDREVILDRVRASLSFPEGQPFACLHAPSRADYRGTSVPWPTLIYTPSFSTPAGNPPQGYFVGKGQVPSFPVFATAFNAFFFDRFTVTGSPNPELGVANIHVVDGRARIRGVRVRPTSIVVSLGGSALRGTHLELNGEGYQSVVKVDASRASIPLPSGLPSDAWIWLKSGSAWLDFRSLQQWGGFISPDIQIELPKDAATDVSRLAAQGEGQHVEYKEKLPSDSKDDKRKVFKTVVAFANGEGGTMLFGVVDEDNGVIAIKGILGNPSVERRRLTDLIRDLISPSPRVQIDAEQLDGRVVLVLRVAPGGGVVLEANKPEYYVRRDGTTYYARPGDLEAIAAHGRPAIAPDQLPFPRR